MPATRGLQSVDYQKVRGILEAVAADGRALLTEPEAKAVIGAYGIPVPEIIVAATEADVVIAAQKLRLTAPAIVVKMLSKTISHKSDLGGVVLDLKDGESAGAAAREIRARVAAQYPDNSLDGFAVQPMIRRSGAEELIVGINVDPVFGPTILFGKGGTAVEVEDDTATGLAPLDEVFAGELIDRTRVSRLLAGYRDAAPAKRDAIVGALLSLSQLTIDFPAIAGVDINPLLADADGVIALDARVEINPARIAERGPNASLSIRPYPSGWESTTTAEGRTYTIRPIRPDDAGLYPAFLSRVTSDDLRLRFLTTLKAISPEMLIRLTQLDYDRDIAFVALDRASGELAAIVRYASDPDHEAAEFGVLVRSDLQGQGLGRILMRQLIVYAKAEGLQRLDGLVFEGNKRMQAICRELGFSIAHGNDGPGLVRARLSLASQA